MKAPDIKSVFLGSNSENEALYKEVLVRIIEDTTNFRKNYHAQDAPIIREKDKSTEGFIETKNLILDELQKALSKLKESVPTWDVKYMAHFHGDLLIPAIAGNVASILYNPNNVTDEASSATLPMEMDFMGQLSDMIGFSEFGDITKQDKDNGNNKSWGHLASGGTIANIEGIWVARNLKYVPISLGLIYNHLKEFNTGKFLGADNIISKVVFKNYDKKLISNCFIEIESILKNIGIKLPNGKYKSLEQLNYNSLFNIGTTVIMGLRQSIVDKIKQFDKKTEEDDSASKLMLDIFNELYEKASIRTLGLFEIHQLTGLKTPKIFISSTCHNTWNKMPEILGLGQNALVKIPVDKNYHINIIKLKNKIIEYKKDDISTLAVIGVFGSTEEGAMDPIDKILKIKSDFEQENYSFYVHIDAAYGGYYASLLSKNEQKLKILEANPKQIAEISKISNNVIQRIKHLLSEFYQNESIKKNGLYNSIIKQIKNTINDNWIKSILALKEADSIVIDPHKLGYVPYPAGSILFRDSRSREQTSFDAPYLEWSEKNIEWSGVKTKSHVYAGKSTLECSRPGSASAACYLASKVLPLTVHGYGKLMAYSLINTQKFISVLKNFNKVENSSLNSGFKIQLQYEQPDMNVIGWVVGLPKFIEKPIHINSLNEMIFSGMAKFKGTSVFSYNYFVSKTYLSFAKYFHVLKPILLKLGINENELTNTKVSSNLSKKKLAILRSVLMNPLLFYLDDSHFNGFWIQQLELAKQALPKLLLQILVEKNDGNRLNIIWIENEERVKKSMQKVQYESLLSNHINIDFVVGNKFVYDSIKKTIVANDKKTISLLNRNGLKKFLILDMNLVDSDHQTDNDEKVAESINLIRSLKDANGFNVNYNSQFIIPCSEYFSKKNNFSRTLKKQLLEEFGIEEKFCVAKPSEVTHNSGHGLDFSFELIKRIFLASERLFS